MAKITKVGMTDPKFYAGKDIECNVCSAHFEIEPGDEIEIVLDKSTSTHYASMKCPSCGLPTSIYRETD